MNAYDENIQYLIKVLRGPTALKKNNEYVLQLLRSELVAVEDGRRVDSVILHRIEATEQNGKELEKFVERTKDLRAGLIEGFREANLND